MIRRSVPAVIVAALLLLTGCTADPAPEPAPTTTAPAEPPVAAERPYPAFGGACERVLDAEEVRAASGTAAEPQPLAPYAQIWAVAALGGLSCRWGEGNDLVLSATVMPADAAAGPIAEQNAALPSCYAVDAPGGARDSCAFGVVADGWWFAGVLTAAPGVDGAAAAEALGAAFAARAAGATPETVAAPEGAWATAHADCAALDGEVGAAELLGSPGLAASAANGPASAGPGVYVALGLTGYLACIWDGGTGQVPGFSIEVVPGAAWALDDVLRLPGAEETEVDGAVRAVRASPLVGAELDYLYLSDGVNLLILEPTYHSVPASALAPIVPALVAALGAGE